MYRTGGILALLIGMTLAFLWAFLPFSEDLGYRVRFSGDQSVWTRVEVECPSPWAVVVEGERPTGVEYATVGDECVKPALTLLSGAVVALAVAVGLAIYGLNRGPRPPVEPIKPISEVIGDPRRS